ncbi:5833_t:CDS:1, partial [Cetraspora pellucida]
EQRFYLVNNIERTTKMNHEICQLVDSICGKTKLNVHGYLLVKDKNRNEKYYWCCEYKNTLKCNGRATMNLVGEEHLLMKFVEHNHALITSHVDVVQTLNSMKNAAFGSSDPPAQIIQNTITNMLQDSYSYMPNNNALCKQISYVRKKHLPSQPQSLQDINIPINLRQTIHREQFLAKNIEY